MKKANALKKSRKQPRIDRNGISLIESIIQPFAREADLSSQDAYAIVAGDPVSCPPAKERDFIKAIESQYGNLESLQNHLENL